MTTKLTREDLEEEVKLLTEIGGTLAAAIDTFTSQLLARKAIRGNGELNVSREKVKSMAEHFRGSFLLKAIQAQYGNYTPLVLLNSVADAFRPENHSAAGDARLIDAVLKEAEERAAEATI